MKRIRTQSRCSLGSALTASNSISLEMSDRTSCSGLATTVLPSGIVSETIPEGKATVASPEQEVLALISNEMLFEAVNGLPTEQRDCILMRFIQGLSIAQTAAALGRSEGAIKQLQLRAVRSLAKSVPEDVR